MEISRKKSSIKNVLIGLLLLLVSSITAFLYRMFFLKILPIEYLGASSLVMSVISVLSLTELGLGVSITYFLYKPLGVDGDVAKVASIVRLLKRAYLVLAGITLAIGLVLIPLLPLLIKDPVEITPDITIVYVFYLLGTTMSYLTGPKTIVLTADQKEYINKSIVSSIRIFSQILALILLTVTKQYMAVLIVENSFVVLQYVLTTLVVRRKYPYLKGKAEPLPKEERRKIFKYTGSMFIAKVGSIVLVTTDTIIISKMLGVDITGIYSNYLLIITSINSILTIIYAGVTASLGNYVAKESIEKQYKMYRFFNMISCWLAAFTAIGLYFVSDTFITVWVGSEYTMEKMALIAMCGSFFIENLARSNGTFIGVLGLVNKTVKVSILYPIVNLAVSIVLVYFMGLPGVFIGTIIARLSVYWYEVWVVNNYGFKCKSSTYYKPFFYYILLSATALGLTFAASLANIDNIYAKLVYMTVMVVIISNGVFLLGNLKTQEFKKLLDFVPARFKRKNKTEQEKKE